MKTAGPSNGTRQERAAAGLIEAQGARRPLAALPDACAPRSRDEAYAVQDLVRARLGPTRGWKTGAPSPDAEPIAAPLLARRMTRSPAVLPAGDFHMVGIEAELAFRFARPLPARPEAYAAEEIFEAVESLHAAIELVDTRLPDWEQADPLWILADNQSNGFFILGSGTAAWRDRDLSAAALRLEIDGETVVERTGGNAAGDPLRLLLWLVDHCRARRGGLEAGALVTTGSCSGMIFVDGGADVRAGFAGIGEVVLSVSD